MDFLGLIVESGWRGKRGGFANLHHLCSPRGGIGGTIENAATQNTKYNRAQLVILRVNGVMLIFVAFVVRKKHGVGKCNI